MPDFAEVSRLVVFTSFNHYTAQIERRPDLDVAGVMDAWYELAGASVAAAGGQVVKFIGDAMLAVFPPEAAERGVLALLALKDASDRHMAEHGWECPFVAKVHFGPVVEGHFGTRSEKRYDVLGKTVNVAARLDASGVTLSVEAFQQLSAAGQQHLKKHTR